MSGGLVRLSRPARQCLEPGRPPCAGRWDWASSTCQETVNTRLMDGFCRSTTTCTANPDVACVAVSGGELCGSELVAPPYWGETGHEPWEPFSGIGAACMQVSVALDCTSFNQGRMECWNDPDGVERCPDNPGDLDNCAALEADPNCRQVSRQCAGAATGRSGVCYVDQLVYDCGTTQEITGIERTVELDSVTMSLVKAGVSNPAFGAWETLRSPLSRILNEQLRGPAGLGGYGRAKHPNCAGIPVAALAEVDWSRVDLSEWLTMLTDADLILTTTGLDLTTLTDRGRRAAPEAPPQHRLHALRLGQSDTEKYRHGSEQSRDQKRSGRMRAGPRLDRAPLMNRQSRTESERGIGKRAFDQDGETSRLSADSQMR
ncbi:conjugal transfer protein TraN [Allochromatium palmeri]|uniref:conjugal transfer protein TraN n=1 Tax=Allochromatium palmeri TaxID=231048 RepID=UPI001FEAF311|nr:conjugal transfer protein TraN [Allochromatium palmeri]